MQKYCIGELTDKIDNLKQKRLSEQTNNDYIEDLKKENEILKHGLKIVELKLSLKKNGGISEPRLKTKNVDLRSQLSQITFELDFIKIEHKNQKITIPL